MTRLTNAQVAVILLAIIAGFIAVIVSSGLDQAVSA